MHADLWPGRPTGIRSVEEQAGWSWWTFGQLLIGLNPQPGEWIPDASCAHCRSVISTAVPGVDSANMVAQARLNYPKAAITS